MNWSEVSFTQPTAAPAGRHHAAAAAANDEVRATAWAQLSEALNSRAVQASTTHLLLKAAAGAGKSHVLRHLVVQAAGNPGSRRVGVTAFTNNQIRPLAAALGDKLSSRRVALHLKDDVAAQLPQEIRNRVTVTTTASQIPGCVDVVVSTASKLAAPGERKRLAAALGRSAMDDLLYDVLFVDEAWQLAHHQFDPIATLAPVVVGVGDVGQIPPLEVGANPWRGNRSHNPYRAWPVAFVDRDTTWTRQLPAVWRPPAEAIHLWRTFYPDFVGLDSVAAEGDRLIRISSDSTSAPLWRQVGSGTPTLVEVDGLPPPDAPDVDLPLMQLLETWLADLFDGGFVVESAAYDQSGAPTGQTLTDAPRAADDGDPLVAILATRNQAVDDAAAMADQLRDRFNLRPRDIVASTVDAWQGQTNALTIAIHPLNGATELDEFNSAFGRLAVACTRATHGVLLLTRAGLDDLLETAPARPGIPFGEPGTRALPRQTHQRILGAFARAKIASSD